MSKKTSSYVFGKNRGLGVYRDKQGRLTYKSSGSKSLGLTDRGTDSSRDIFKSAKKSPGKTKAAPQKPTQKNAPRPKYTPLDDAFNRQKADITGYYAAFADILKGIAPQIGEAYSGAAGRISDYGRGTYEGLRDLLGQSADEAQAQFNQTTGNYLTPEVAAQVGQSYNADKAADIGYSIGAYLPAKTLEEAGAAFQAAGAMAPLMAHQQGLYALSAAQREAAERAQEAETSGEVPAGSAKASASLSSKLGYLVDVYGQPILNKNGQPIRLPNQGLTPYQQYLVDLSAQKEARYKSNEAFDRELEIANLSLRNKSHQLAVQKEVARGRQIDPAASNVRGFVVDKNGRPVLDGRGKRIPVKKTAPIARNSYQRAVVEARKLRGTPILSDPDFAPQGKYRARPGERAFKDGTTNDIKKAQFTGSMTWNEASVYIQEAYGLTKAQARKALVAIGWLPGRAKTRPRKTDPGGHSSGGPSYR
jgi:hypothetical protein